MADDIFVSNDIELDVDFGEVFVIDQGIVTKVVAKKYDPTKTYIVGEYVIYSDNLYRCTTAIVEPEEFDNTKWTKVLLADEVQTINTALPLKADKSDTYTKQEVDTALGGKADKADTYTKSEVNTALADKADKSTTYTKTEVDTALSAKANTTDVDTALTLKADKADTYTKTAVDNALALKADQATTYTKSDVDSALSAKANSSDVYDKTEVYTKSQVDSLISNLPEPMIMKGTLGTGGTITTLPTASSDNEGYTYKVITAGTYASQPAKVGDLFTSCIPEGASEYVWLYIPSGDETFTDTWRGIKVNGTEQLTSSIASGDVDFVNGTNSTVVFDATGNKIKVNVDGYTQSEIDTKLALKADASTTYSKTEVDTALSSKANTSDVNTALDGKADKSTTYTKTEVDSALSSKANSSDVYTKTQTDTALANKANTTGEYDNLTSGQAKELKPSAQLLDKEPYLFRQSFSNGYENDKLVGVSVAWNQLYDISIGTNGFRAAGSTLTATGTKTKVACSGSGVSYFGVCPADANLYQFRTINGHKYYLCANLSDINISDNNYQIIFGNGLSSNIANVSTTIRGIGQGNGSILYINAVFGTFTTSDNFTIDSLQIIDLTAMFGNTIADYIYNLEQATAGAGVAWFRKLFPNSYYPYDAGSLKSVKTTAHKMVGKNLINDSVKYYNNGNISFGNSSEGKTCYLPAGTYTYTITTADNLPSNLYAKNVDTNERLFTQYDALSKTFTLDSGCNIAFWVYKSTYTSANDIKTAQVELGSQTTAYEPYTEHNYPLDDVELRGLFKLDSNNKLYADGDTYESSGAVTRKYAIVDLGALNWTEGFNGFYSTGISSVVKVPDNVNTEVCLCGGYSFSIDAGTDRSYFIQVIDVYRGWLIIRDSRYSSASDFKAAVSGKYLIYPLATPTTETADPFTNPQQVDANGTEEYIDSRTPAIPVGHETVYVDNSDKTKLDNLPDISNDGDGTYVIKQEDGQMKLTAYSNELPAYPNIDGNYRLNVSISGGVPVLSWEEITE